MTKGRDHVWVYREDLLKPLVGTPAASLITIDAPTGSGKSTLWRQFGDHLSRPGVRLVHVRHGTESGELPLMHDLSEAMRVDGLTADLELPHRNGALDRFTARFDQELGSLADRTYVIIGDCHRYKSASAIKCLANLAHLEPRPPLSIVVASRAA